MDRRDGFLEKEDGEAAVSDYAPSALRVLCAESLQRAVEVPVVFVDACNGIDGAGTLQTIEIVVVPPCAPRIVA